MDITIVHHDNTIKILSITNQQFLKDVSEDKYNPSHEKSVLSRTCHSLSLDCKSFFKTGNSEYKLLQNKGLQAEKLPVKMRIKNSSSISKKLQDEFHNHLKDKNFKGAFGGLIIRSQHSFIKLN